MRILAVTPYYLPDGGGLERYAHETLAALVRRGHEVHAMAASVRPRVDVVIDGVDVRFHQPTLRLGNAPVRAGLTAMVRAAIRRTRADVVIGHAPVPFAAEAAARAARREQVPFVLTYHAGRLRGSSMPLELLAGIARRTTQPALFRRSDALIAVSGHVRDNALAQHSERVTVIAPGVDASFVPGHHDPRQILFVGPLDSHYAWKGVDVLWEAYSILRRQGVAASLRLVGDGDRRGEFEQRARAWTGVQVDGRLSEQELHEAYQQAGVLVLPSTTDAEAFGMVLAEANACGRPVIGSRIGGIPDFIRSGDNGLLCRPGDAADLAQQLAVLVQDHASADAMGRRGRRRIMTDHTWEGIAARTEAVLEGVTLRSSRRGVPAAAVA